MLHKWGNNRSMIITCNLFAYWLNCLAEARFIPLEAPLLYQKYIELMQGDSIRYLPVPDYSFVRFTPKY